VVRVGAVSYAGLFGILLWQALGGESVAAPTRPTLIAVGLWALASAVAAWQASEGPGFAPTRVRRDA